MYFISQFLHACIILCCWLGWLIDRMVKVFWILLLPVYNSFGDGRPWPRPLLCLPSVTPYFFPFDGNFWQIWRFQVFFFQRLLTWIDNQLCCFLLSISLGRSWSYWHSLLTEPCWRILLVFFCYEKCLPLNFHRIFSKRTVVDSFLLSIEAAGNFFIFFISKLCHILNNFKQTKKTLSINYQFLTLSIL